MSFDLSNFTIAAPLLALAAGALIVLLFDLLLPAKAAQAWWYIAGLASVGVAGYYLVPLWGARSIGFNGAMVMDSLATVFAVVLLGTLALTLVIAFTRSEIDKSGYLALLLWAGMGMLMMASAGNLMTVFLGLELLSLALYVAVAFDQSRPNAREAALKYFVLGSVASAFLLFGFALIYGTVGTMDLGTIAKTAELSSPMYYKVGVALTLVGFGFKLALVPFHAWAPDVYQGAPTATTAFMSVGTKAAAFAMTARFLIAVIPAGHAAAYLLPLSVIAAASMLWGSLVGMWQGDLKRMMAYSGIAHAGYLIMAIPAMSADGLSAAAYYMAAYGFTAMGIFAIIALLESEGEEGANLSTFTSLYYRRPVLAAALSVFMFALAGLPPTGGFIGKFLLAKAAVGAASSLATNSWILLLGLILSTGISAYVYLRVIGTMFKKPATEAIPRKLMAGAEEGELALAPAAVRTGLLIVIAVGLIGTLVLGILPGPVMDLFKIAL